MDNGNANLFLEYHKLLLLLLCRATDETVPWCASPVLHSALPQQLEGPNDNTTKSHPQLGHKAC